MQKQHILTKYSVNQWLNDFKVGGATIKFWEAAS